MALTRRFTLPAHGAAEFVAGFAMMIAPALLGFGVGGLVLSAALGALLTGMALGVSTAPSRRTLAWHVQFDNIFLLLTALTAFVLAVAGDGAAGLFLAAMVLVLAVLNTATRYATAS